MEIDISKTKYRVKAVLSSGEILNLTDLCQALSWEDQKGSIAERADITLINTRMDKGYVSDKIQLCSLIFIYADNSEVFRGVVWEWEYTSSLKKELDITAYDKMIYATQSKSNSYFSSGKSTKTIIQSICGEWKIPLNYMWESWTHGKLLINNKAVSEHITSVLDEAETKLKSKYVALMEKDILVIKTKGQNENIFVFNTSNVISTKDRLSMQNLVTKVIVVGKSEENKRPPIVSTINGKTEYGILQEIVTKDTNKSLDDAKKEAEKILKEKGKPEESIEVSTVDVPMIRKGYKVLLNAGNLKGYFIVDGVSHNAFKKTMNMELSRYE